MPGPSSPIKVVIELTELLKLKKIQRSLKSAHSLVLRVTIVLLIIAGLAVSQVSRKTNVTRNTVKKWAKRYSELGLDGLKDLPRKGCPPDFDAEIAKELIRTKIVISISGESVRRILNVQKLKPWRHHMWLSEKKPRDQEFCDKVRDVCDIYFRVLESWECVLSVDENTSIQARKRIAEPVKVLDFSKNKNMSHFLVS